MNKFKKILLTTTFIILIIFIIQNATTTNNIFTSVNIKFIKWQVELPVIILLLLSYILGIFSYIIIKLPVNKKNKKELESLKNDNLNLKKEIDNLRNIPLED